MRVRRAQRTGDAAPPLAYSRTPLWEFSVAEMLRINKVVDEGGRAKCFKADPCPIVWLKIKLVPVANLVRSIFLGNKRL